jgi:hypothetical protein
LRKVAAIACRSRGDDFALTELRRALFSDDCTQLRNPSH